MKRKSQEIKRFASKYSFYLLVSGLLFHASAVRSQAGLFFTHNKVSNLRKLETAEKFLPGDTIYGVLYVSAQNSNVSLDDYTLAQNGSSIVPVTITAENDNQISFNAELASGLNKPKKSGLMAALNNAVGTQSQAFYFLVLPSSNDNLSTNWIKFFANLTRSPKTIKTIKVSAGTGEYFHTVSSTFILDFSGGARPYSNWCASYLQQEAKANEEKEAEKIAKIKADSTEKVKAAFDETEKSFPPGTLKSKINDAKLQKEITDYLKGFDYQEVYKVCIWDAENSSTFLVFAVVKRQEKCFIVGEWLERQNPYGDIIKFKFADLRDKLSYKAYPLRCEKVQEYLK